ncbi:MAG: hypothetical protein ABSC21_01315 [Terriglobia bacterium]
MKTVNSRQSRVDSQSLECGSLLPLSPLPPYSLLAVHRKAVLGPVKREQARGEKRQQAAALQGVFGASDLRLSTFDF